MSNVTSEVGDMTRDGMSMEASRGLKNKVNRHQISSPLSNLHPPIVPKSANHIVIYQIVTLLLT